MAISIGGYSTKGIGNLLNEYADKNTDITQSLATGERPNAAENPAKDSIAAKLKKSITILKAASEGIAIGSAITTIAESAGSQIVKNLQDLTDLAIRATNTVSDTEKVLLDKQFQSVISATDRIAKTAKFGDKVLLDGSLAGGNNIETDITGTSESAQSYSKASYGFLAPQTVDINGVYVKSAATNLMSEFNFSVDTMATAATGTDIPEALEKLAGALGVELQRVDTLSLDDAAKNALKDMLNDEINPLLGGTRTTTYTSAADVMADTNTFTGEVKAILGEYMALISATGTVADAITAINGADITTTATYGTANGATPPHAAVTTAADALQAAFQDTAVISATASDYDNDDAALVIARLQAVIDAISAEIDSAVEIVTEAVNNAANDPSLATDAERAGAAAGAFMDNIGTAKAEFKVEDFSAIHASVDGIALVEAMTDSSAGLFDTLATTVEDTMGFIPDAGFADITAVADAVTALKYDPVPATGVTHDLLYQAEDVKISLKDGTAPASANETLFSLDDINLNGTFGTLKVELLQSGGTATADIAIPDTIVTGKERAKFIANAINISPTLKESFKASVVETTGGADLVLKRLAVGTENGTSYKVNVAAGSVVAGSGEIESHIASITVGDAVTEVTASSAAVSAPASNVELVAERVSIYDSSDKVDEAVARLFQNAAKAGFLLESSRDMALLLSAQTDPSVDGNVLFESKKQGTAGNFLIKNITSPEKSQSAVYGNAAEVGSLGIGNVFVAGGVAADALIKSVGGQSASTGFVKVDNATLVDGGMVKFSGREYTLRSQVQDPAYEIQLKDGDPIRTLENIVNFLNSSHDPSLSNFVFEAQSVASADGFIVENQLQVTTKAFTDFYNGATMTVEEPNAVPGSSLTARLILQDGFANGLDLSNVNDNKDFLGNIKGFKASYTDVNSVKLQVEVGDIMYEGMVQNTNPALDTAVIMESNQELGGYFILTLGGERGIDVTNASDADVFATTMDRTFEQLSFYQRREITSFKPEDGSTVEDTKAYMMLSEYPKAFNMIDVQVNSAAVDGFASIIVSTSDGRVFINREQSLGSSTNVGQMLELVDADDSNSKIVLVFGKDIDLSNAEGADRFRSDLSSAFKADLSPMKFQVGESEDEVIPIEFDDMTIEALFQGTTINIATTADCNQAKRVLNQALLDAIASTAGIGGTLKELDTSAEAVKQGIIANYEAFEIMNNVDITEKLAEYTENNNRITAGTQVLRETRMQSSRLIQTLFS